MSRTSRNLEDGGDRTLDFNTDEEVQRVPIRFFDPGTQDWTISMPRELAEHASVAGKHREDLLRELAILYRRYVRDGEFSISYALVDQLYTSAFRRKLMAILADTATCTKKHLNLRNSKRCRRYRFNFKRPKKAPRYNDIPDDGDDDPAFLLPNRIHITIPAAWLWNRYERWFAICDRYGWTSNLDFDGRTDWGVPLFKALGSALIPDTAETERLTKRGVVKCAVRKRGRCYHPLTNLRKDLRRATLFDGEPIAEVDIHACYTALLISLMHEGPAKNRAIKAVQSDWYAQFQNAYEEWFRTQIARGNGYVADNGQWMLRLDDDAAHDTPASIKVEYQRQCLFWRDPRQKSRTLRLELRRLHPEFCHFIQGLRRRLTPTELSDVLMRAEGSLVVDSAMAELERAGIKVLSNHDAVIVNYSQANDAREILLGVCRWHLGFEPRVTIKTGEIATAKLLTQCQ